MPNPTTVLSQDVLAQIIKLRGEEQPSKPKEPEFQRDPIEIPEGYKAFSDVFGFKPSTGLDHALKVFLPEDWPEDVRVFIPELDKTYVWPRENTEVFVVGLINGDKSLIIGPTGSGKSTLVKNVCALLNIPFIRINFFNQVEYSAVFGMPKIKNGTMSYEHGPIGVLGQFGGVLCLDEFSSASSDITMSLQYVLEDNGQIYLPDYPGPARERLITPNPLFRLVATDNTELQGDTTGRHAGTNVQNTATLDRFQTVIRHEYLDKKHETKVIKEAVPKIPAEWVKDMLRLAELVRDGYERGNINITMSPRTLINWGRKAVYWGNIMMGLKLAFTDKLLSDDKKVVTEFVNKVFGPGRMK